MGHYHDVSRELSAAGRDLRSRIPDVYATYAESSNAAMGTEGVLDSITKELLAFVIGVASHCDGCYISHARKLAHLGASEQQVAEALGVAIFMMGGPGTVYGARAFEAFLEFRPAQKQQVQ
ncbi:carboxymuconolactone decarboxylase family protein [bacterium BMS3Bbin02]|nr:carboxymuconolactone decarboxylase family protein [bacterium BMS3Bbin02]